MKISGTEKMKNTAVHAASRLSSSEEHDVGFPMYIAWYVAGLAMIILSVTTY